MVKRQILALRGKQRRRLSRQQVGSLKSNLVSVGVMLRYKKCMLKFFHFLAACSVPLACTLYDMDCQLQDFVDHLWNEGDPRQWAADALSGFHLALPYLRGNIRGSWRLYECWGRLELPARALPISPDLVVAFAMRRIQLGEVRYAVTILLAFHCLLRTAEFCALKVSDLHLDLPRGRGALRIVASKTGQRFGTDEGVTVDDPCIISLAAAAFKNVSPAARMLPITMAEFRSKFKEDAVAFGVDPDDYRPYCLRRGGTTPF